MDYSRQSLAGLSRSTIADRGVGSSGLSNGYSRPLDLDGGSLRQSAYGSSISARGLGSSLYDRTPSSDYYGGRSTAAALVDSNNRGYERATSLLASDRYAPTSSSLLPSSLYGDRVSSATYSGAPASSLSTGSSYGPVSSLLSGYDRPYDVRASLYDRPLTDRAYDPLSSSSATAPLRSSYDPRLQLQSSYPASLSSHPSGYGISPAAEALLQQRQQLPSQALPAALHPFYAGSSLWTPQQQVHPFYPSSTAPQYPYAQPSLQPQPQSLFRPAVLVVGASGAVGEATIKALVAKYSSTLDIRAGVRDVNKARAKFGTLAGLQIVHADMSQPHTLVQAMQGVDRVFCVVSPTIDRTQQAIACANAAVQANVRFLLMLSVLSADGPPGIFARQFAPIEAHVKQLPISSSIIRLPMFFENNFGNKNSIVSQQTIYGPGLPQARWTGVAVQDIGESAAAILADPARHNGRIYKLVAPSINNEEVAQSFSSALGRTIRYQQVPYPQARQSLQGMGLQDHQVDGVLELLSQIDYGAPALNERDTSDIERILGRPATTFNQWVNSVKAAFA